MSFFKATWWRPATALAVLALAVGALSLTGTGTANAGDTDGAISVSPVTREIGEGGSGTVDVVLTPAAAGISVWIIEISYDPAVAQVAVDGDDNPICTFINVQSPFIGAGGCDTKAVSHGTTPDTLVVLGGVVQNDNGTAKGLTTQQTLATFTFNAVGSAGASTALTVSVSDFLGPNGQTPTAAVSNGAIEIIESTGTARIWGDFDCRDGAPVPRDGQAILKFVLVQDPLPQQEPCPNIGTTVIVDGVSRIWGDSDCRDGAPVPRDGQAILKFVLVQDPLPQTEPCPNIGTTVQVSD